MPTTIEPIEIGTQLKVRDGRVVDDKAKGVMLRWLDRYARRKGRFSNRPSLHVQTERDIDTRQTFLQAFVDTVSDTSPPWFADMVVDRSKKGHPK
ncbi:hypothetical protein LCGC14_0945020 [marine sediment metagenome]|uniref:Uncharacterized protein n=1 Tax=marine sediment metagenome TaxID=412755 RepID=A0A0F9NJ04_9ZZZZ